ncbi:Aste57867_2829 [Aphanomyces stellatus]|uniref:Aste57867_2829 protein n=1 Tax=Aphanomyces stellatus TaxID=120398 RepID=A0A485KA21_9STRA|nr:hypothetical protein As57867_002822 [Aphanomyces stellatus]VFT80017.1 Aste57867_2829 [Aphanomyces stellatus]
MLRQLDFVHKMCRHYDYWYTPSVVQAAIARYHQFMHLIRISRDTLTMLVPTPDIDLVWHTHQCHPRGYFEFCRSTVGDLIDHDDTIQANDLHVGYAETSLLWAQVFQGEYTSKTSAPSNCAFGISDCTTKANSDCATNTCFSCDGKFASLARSDCATKKHSDCASTFAVMVTPTQTSCAGFTAKTSCAGFAAQTSCAGFTLHSCATLAAHSCAGIASKKPLKDVESNASSPTSIVDGRLLLLGGAIEENENLPFAVPVESGDATFEVSTPGVSS